MAQLSVPPRHRGPLRRLAALSEDERESLVAELRALPAFTAMPEVTARVQAVTGAETVEEARSLAGALISLTAQRTFWSASELAETVARDEDLAVPENEQEALSTLLAKLVEAEPLVTMGKAIDVMTEHEHVYQSARIMTDIRPIFRDEPSDEPTGAALLGLLVLNHLTDGEVRSIHVAMDRADLHALRAVVDRAIDKMNSLSSLLARTDLTSFEYEEVDESH